MAAFDPSVISEIGASAIPDVAGARARAYTLADLVNTEQLDRLRLNEEKKQQSDAESVRSILAKQDLSTAAGINKAAAALTSAGFSDQGLKLMSVGQQYQTGAIQQAKERNEADLARLKKYSAQMDVAANVFDEIREPLDRAKAAGMPPAMLDEMTRRAIVPAMQRLEQDLPEFSPQIRQFLATPSHLTYSGLVLAEQKTNEGQRLFEQEIRKREVANTERHQQVEEGFRAREVAAKEKEAAATEMGGKRGALLAAFTAEGVTLPSGFRGQKQIAGTLQGLLDRYPDKDPDQIAREVKLGILSFTGEKASATQLAKMEGATRAALKQLDFNVGKASEYMDKVPATDLSPILNAIVRGEEKWTGNPNIAPLFFYMNGVAQEAARLQSGGQASTAQLHEGAAAEARKWLDAGAITPASWKKLAPEILAEGKNRLQNFTEARDEMTGATPPAAETPATAPKRITSDADYNALPSGATFIAPDGSTRRKP